jgi:hypothetical protein
MHVDDTKYELATNLGAMTNLVHGFVYFAAEAFEEYASIGLPNKSYFAPRAAPMGPVTAPVVAATFFNFSPDRVGAEIPAAWDFASPSTIQDARLRGVARVLNERVAGVMTSESVAEATAIAGEMCANLDFSGKPLAAANHAVVLPADPLTALWQLVTVIREWRGDVHVAALTVAGLTAVEALILHGATGEVDPETLRTSRGWSETDWSQTVANLAARGLVNADGTFTNDGQALRSAIETQTNQACVILVDAVGEAKTASLIGHLKPLRKALLASGIFPWLKK